MADCSRCRLRRDRRGADGLSWEFPDLGVVPGTNRLFRNDVIDSWGVTPNYAAPNPYADSTKVELRFAGGDLSALAGRPVRFRFLLHCATLYSFWISPSAQGESRGYVAAGGPDYPGLRDISLRPS